MEVRIMTFKEKLKQKLANTRPYFKDIVLRVKHRFKFLVVFVYLSYVVLKISIVFGTMSANEYWHARLWLLGGFIYAMVFLPEEERKSDT